MSMLAYVRTGEPLSQFHHRLTAGSWGEGRTAVRHHESHQPGRMWPPQNQQGGETEGEREAAAEPHKRGQVWSHHNQMVSPRSVLDPVCVFS